MQFDVIIVGTGPAGIFSALELTENPQLSILMLEKGPEVMNRKCPASRGLGCITCDPCQLLCGWGGAGAFSDGKLTLSTEVGGWLNRYCDEKELIELINYVDSIYLKFGASKRLYGTNLDKIEEIERKASFAGLKLIRQKVRHLGTEKCAEVLQKMYQVLKDKIEIKTKTEVKRLIVKNGKVTGVETTTGEIFNGKYVIVAPGRSGAEWLKREAQSLGLKTLNNPVDVGLRDRRSYLGPASRKPEWSVHSHMAAWRADAGGFVPRPSARRRRVGGHTPGAPGSSAADWIA